MNSLSLNNDPTVSTTTDEDLHLLIDGQRVNAFDQINISYRFNIPQSAKVIRLRSRASTPAKLGIATDSRVLGFCVTSLSSESSDGTFMISISLGHRLLKDGFYESEGQLQRWTNGDALLPSILFSDSADNVILTITGRGLALYDLNESAVLVPVPMPTAESSQFEVIKSISDNQVNWIDAPRNERIKKNLKLSDIFDYYSYNYYSRKINPIGFIGKDNFFIQEIFNIIEYYPNQIINIISIGTGSFETEIKIAKSLISLGLEYFKIDCLDFNPLHLNTRDESKIDSELEGFINILEENHNNWLPSKSYHVVIVNQSIQQTNDLEHLFNVIEIAISVKNGIILIADEIGKGDDSQSSRMIDIIDEFWMTIPKKYKYNHESGQYQDSFLNLNQMVVDIEKDRTQDLFSLFADRFHYDLIFLFSNIIAPFIGKAFGPNFDMSSEQDRIVIARILHKEAEQINLKNINPTQIYAVLSKDFSRPMNFYNLFNGEIKNAI